MAWGKALASYGLWIAAHALGGALLVVLAALIPVSAWWVVLIHGLAAGVLFGVPQSLVWRRFIPDLKWWLPVTVLASPFSWFWGIWYAMATFTLAGWLGAAVSAAAQFVVLAVHFRDDRRLAMISLLWLPAAVIGGAFFYFCYLLSTFTPDRSLPPQWELILAGSVGFGIVTGLVVAALAGLVDSPQERQHALHQ